MLGGAEPRQVRGPGGKIRPPADLPGGLTGSFPRVSHPAPSSPPAPRPARCSSPARPPCGHPPRAPRTDEATGAGKPERRSFPFGDAFPLKLAPPHSRKGAGRGLNPEPAAGRRSRASLGLPQFEVPQVYQRPPSPRRGRGHPPICLGGSLREGIWMIASLRSGPQSCPRRAGGDGAGRGGGAPGSGRSGLRSGWSAAHAAGGESVLGGG